MGMNICMILASIGSLASFIPALCLIIRRLHDVGMSGWFLLINIIPVIGGIILLIFTLLPSQKHENKYGVGPAQPLN